MGCVMLFLLEAYLAVDEAPHDHARHHLIGVDLYVVMNTE